MRIPPLALVFAFSVSSLAADPPPKRGFGFFGFGEPPSDQISGDLFPQSGAASSSPSSGERPASAEGIFRGGQPQAVEPVSYVIENGRRVERPIPASMKKRESPSPTLPLAAPAAPVVAVPKPAPGPAPVPAASPVAPASPVATPVEGAEGKKRGSWFGFGKRDDPPGPENPVLAPVPAAAPLLGATPVAEAPKPSAKPASKPKPAPAPLAAKPLEAKPAGTTAPSPVAEPTLSNETPPFANAPEEKEKGERFGWIPFLGRKKSEEPATSPATSPATVAMPAAAPVSAGSPSRPPAETVASAPASKPAPEPAAPAGVPAAKPAETTASPAVATFEIRRDPSKPAEPEKTEKTDRDGGILSPISKIRPPRKEIDLTGAETIIENGEIVGGTDTLAASVETDTTAPRQAPQVVNGVKTYSSWNDIEARPSSAADKIISRIR